MDCLYPCLPQSALREPDIAVAEMEFWVARSGRSNLPTRRLSVAVLVAQVGTRNAQMKHSLSCVDVAVGVDLRRVC